MEDGENKNVICKAIMKANRFPKVVLVISIIILIIGAILFAVASITWDDGLMAFGAFLMVVGLIFIFVDIPLSAIESCKLVLHDKGIDGVVANGFSCKQLQLPTNKIDSIFLKNSFFDSLCGGQTIVIRSASGLIKFHCVQNAKEFVNFSLSEIQKWQDFSHSAEKIAPVSTSGTDNIETIQKLKTLFDQGIITQEEYDAKKKDLLSKI